MIFKVMDRLDAIAFSQKDSITPYVIISISISGGTPPRFKDSDSLKDVLYLFFDDVEDSRLGGTPMTSEDAKAAIRFIDKHRTIPLVIIHCDAGISRSSGVCAGLMKVFAGSEMVIFRNPHYCPNIKCYREILSCAEQMDIKPLESHFGLDISETEYRILTIQSDIFSILCELEEACLQFGCICDDAPHIRELQEKLTSLREQLAILQDKKISEVSCDLEDYESAVIDIALLKKSCI